MRKLKIQRKLRNFNSNVKTKINNEIKRKGKKGFIWEIIFSFLIFCASAVLIFVLYIIISAPNFEKDKLYKNKLKFKIGDSFNLDKLKQKLVELGYTRCELIEGRGQFSIRGGIVDISISYKTGIRIEFWGDEIDSIRDFNISTQRSINTKENVIIYPAHEYVLEKGIEEICDKIKKDNANKEIIEEDIEQIKAGNYISKIDKYFDSFYEKQGTILDYLNNNYCIFLDEIGKINQRAKNIQEDNKTLQTKRVK